jgi:sugar phosphate permease
MWKELSRKQWTVLVLTFMSMVAAHSSRESWFMVETIQVKPKLTTDLELSGQFLGSIDSVFLFCYGLGYYASGILGDKFGLVNVLTIGMWAASALYGLISILGFLKCHTGFPYLLLWALQGPAQGCILTTTVSLMTNWFSPEQRAEIMGIWGSNASVGNIMGEWIVAILCVGFGLQWEVTMLLNTFIVLVVATLVFLFVTDTPKVNVIELPLIVNQSQPPMSFWSAWKIPGVAYCALAYAGMKFMNYSFLMWLPYFLVIDRGLPLTIVSVLTTIYDVGGILGSISAGWWPNAIGKTTAVLLMLGISQPFLMCFHMIHSTWPFFIVVPLTGFLLAGTANITSTAIAADLSQNTKARGGKATVVGLINGTGSLGAAFGQIIVRYM